jgi:hypothetical protein
LMSGRVHASEGPLLGGGECSSDVVKLGVGGGGVDGGREVEEVEGGGEVAVDVVAAESGLVAGFGFDGDGEVTMGALSFPSLPCCEEEKEEEEERGDEGLMRMEDTVRVSVNVVVEEEGRGMVVSSERTVSITGGKWVKVVEEEEEEGTRWEGA